MNAAPPSRTVTADELSRMSIPGKSVELVRGEIIVREPPATWHGGISNHVAYLLTRFVREHGLGAVFGQDTGFQIFADPDTVRAPDVAFVRAERLSDIERQGYSRLAPDLVVEVLSPGDRPGEILAKMGDWLEAGVRLVWVLDPKARQARVHRPDGSLALLEADDEIDGEDVLAGFTCPVAELLTPGW